MATQVSLSGIPSVRQRVVLPVCLLVLLAAGVILASIGASTFTLTLSDFWQAISGQASTLAAQLVSTIRLPRVMVAAVAGAALAMAGALMQGITRNPLASPALFGINAGAACLLVMAQSGFLPILTSLPLIVVTAIGAALSGALVLMLGGGLAGRIHPVRVVLAGVAVTALLVALTRTLLILDEQSQSVLDWLSGSLTDIGWKQWHQLWPWVLIAAVLSWLLAQKMNLLALGEEMASGLGVSPVRLRLQVSCLVIILAAATVAITGPIAFVGLLVPHLARRFTGADHRILLPVCAVMGATLMVWADYISRLLVFPSETPIGLVTALIGAPCFLWLASQEVKH
ncbi:FecCD family ABC transporter permease [Oceanospirillum sediminis]|uniref:Iron chelate uptake ABC transporter family permease subunit n=1 Tax=Oceanospirillum sediminis TaxID=2760088 RepID=A0A839IKE6_9GAMM|nr:iron chelate uptake ABC transporter family permease subunit [Oceanospirillum sediminis]MBB1485418.1 iron chelate uptake ABC transporter family permease subunit [Oceanospirillum sediminis]